MENEKLQEQTESMADYEAHFDDANPWNVVARYQEEGTNLHVGDEVDVKVIGIKDGKISLSIKALAEDAEKEQEEELEHVEIPKVEAIGTSLGDLFKNIKL